MYKPRTITRELQSIPFDVAFQLYMDAADVAAATIEGLHKQNYDAHIQRLEQEWNDTHEAPYEGNFEDLHPYNPSPDVRAARTKAGNDALIHEFIPRYKLETVLQNWAMPQIIRWISHKRINFDELRVNGLLQPRQVAAKIFDFKNPWDLGLYQFLMLDSRSCYLQSQYKGEAKQYCSLVPLIPYAFKLHHNIKYSEWDPQHLRAVVNPALADAMLCEVPPDLTREEILQAREQGLVYKTGIKAGQSRSPQTTYKLYDTTNTRLHNLPDLAKTMLAQIWCAHPQNRTKYMVLDPTSWDNIPAPLVAENIFKTTATGYTPGVVLGEPDLPWLL